MEKKIKLLEKIEIKKCFNLFVLIYYPGTEISFVMGVSVLKSGGIICV
jgi:hypothetical protein